MRFELVTTEGKLVVDVERNEGNCAVNVEGKAFRITIERTNEPDELMAHVDGRAVRVRLLEETESSIVLGVGDETFRFKRQMSRFERPASEEKRASRDISALQAPMPGRIISIMVSEGQDVKSGDALLIMESMKMETILMSDREGTVREITVKQGDPVIRGQVLLRYGKGAISR